MYWKYGGISSAQNTYPEDRKVPSKGSFVTTVNGNNLLPRGIINKGPA